MKSTRFAGLRPIHLYQPGDILLEVDRLTASGPIILKTLSETQIAEATDKEKDNFLDFLKPKADDYPALKGTLRFLKFSAKDVTELHEGIGSVINMAAGCVTIVGAVITVADLMVSLFGPKKVDETLQYVKHISQRVDQIYGYLAAQSRRGLYNEAVDWRAHIDNVRNAVANARGSRSPLNLQALVNLKGPLDSTLANMLNPAKAQIAFLRDTYGYDNTAHWIDAAVSPFMTLTDGTAINYHDPAQELQASIWDPGHYVDMLVGSLSDRLLLVATTEPAFRSTNYDRDRLEALLNNLTAFINKWRGSLMVANPLIGLNGGGHLQHPAYDPPIGIPIGAVDPVTGVSFFVSFWDEFDIVNTWESSAAAKGKPDYAEAKDPALALKRALDLQPRLLEGAIRASGIGKLAELRARIQDILARYTVGSDFVDLPNASFHLIQMHGPAAVTEKVDLGFIGKYSKHPNKQYDGRRYTQITEKKFRFAMAMRADVSQIQLGYRLEIGDKNIPLITYSTAPGDGSQPPRFRTAPISLEIHEAQATVYDVHQSGLVNAEEEDRFEGIEPSATLEYLRHARVFPPERIFLNEHKGPIALSVGITFEADLNSPDQAFAGFANVTIRNLDPEHCPGGIILPVTVFETRREGLGTGTEEVPADHMTIHVVPSFLTVGKEYFDDRREGKENMDRIFGAINERFAISAQVVGPVGPEWKIKRLVAQETATDHAITRFAKVEPAAARLVLGRFSAPRPIRG